MPDAYWLGVTVLVVAACVVGAVWALGAARLRRLQPLLNSLRASESETRVKALESIADLPPALRRLAARSVRRTLTPGARPWDRGANARISYWFLRQAFALLGDPRPRVRSDGARLLQAVLGHFMPKDAQVDLSAQPLSKPAQALVEMGAGRSLSRSSRDVGLRVMTLAEFLESGILKPGPQPAGKGERPDGRAAGQLVEEAIAPLGSASRDMNVDVRKGVVEVLGAVGSLDTVPLLEAMLADPSADVRAQAATALGRTANETSIPALAQLLRDPVVQVQAACAQALVELAATSTCPAILEALEKACARHPASHPPIEAMISAAARLGEGSQVALERAIRALPAAAAARLAQALEATGVIARWLVLAQDGQHGSELTRSLLMLLAQRGVRAPFREALESSLGPIRAASAAIMGKCGDASSADVLAPLVRDADLEVRVTAIEALGTLSQPQSAAVLADCIDDPEPRARRAIVGALENIARAASAWLEGTAPVEAQVLRGAVEAVAAAVRRAASDLDDEVRAAAARALAAVANADKDANAILVELALHDTSETVRQQARSSIRTTRPLDAEPVVLAAASDDDASLRVGALYLLAILNGSRVVWRLVEALNDPVTTVRDAALNCLGEVDWGPAAGRLVGHLRSPDVSIRSGVALLLGAPPGAGHLAELADCLTDPDEMVRACALDSLSAHSAAAAPYRHLIAQRSRDPSPVVRERASAALGRLGEPPAADRLLAGLSDADPAVRARNAERLLEMAWAGTLDPLARAVESPDAARAIVEVAAAKGPQAGRALAAALSRAPRPQRVRIITALSPALSHGGGLEVWLEELLHVEPEMRQAAAEAIGLLGDVRGLAPLAVTLEKDPSAQVRQAAARALSDIGGHEAVGSLMVAEREDPDPDVRSMAAGLAQAVSQRAAFPPAQSPGERTA